MKSFEHRNARTVREACELLEKYRGKARVNAGGTDLLAVLKDEILLKPPEMVIDIKTIPELNFIREDREGLSIGALTRLSEIAKSSLVRERYPVLAESAYAVASPQIRNMATIGGNLCQDVRCWYYRYPAEIGGPIPCLRKGKGACLALRGDNRYHAIMGGKRCFAAFPSDIGTALTVLEATIVLARPRGRRRISIRDFFTPLGTVLDPSEIITEIRIPKIVGRNRQKFLKFTLRRPIDFAVVSVATLIGSDDGICREARIGLGAVAPTPVRAAAAELALEGKPLNEEVANQAAEAAVAEAKPLSMNAYKVEITKALVRRALLQ